MFACNVHYCTHVCSYLLYIGLWLSGLSSLFLLQKYWSMLKVVGSNPATGSYSSTFILSIQIRNFPTPLPYHMYVQLPHLGKKCCTTKDDLSLLLYNSYSSMGRGYPIRIIYIGLTKILVLNINGFYLIFISYREM